MPDDRSNGLILPTEAEHRETWLAVRWLLLKFVLKLTLLAAVVLILYLCG